MQARIAGSPKEASLLTQGDRPHLWCFAAQFKSLFSTPPTQQACLYIPFNTPMILVRLLRHLIRLSSYRQLSQRLPMNATCLMECSRRSQLKASPQTKQSYAHKIQRTTSALCKTVIHYYCARLVPRAQHLAAIKERRWKYKRRSTRHWS
jgi:hypothetical protein